MALAAAGVAVSAAGSASADVLPKGLVPVGDVSPGVSPDRALNEVKGLTAPGPRVKG